MLSRATLRTAPEQGRDAPTPGPAAATGQGAAGSPRALARMHGNAAAQDALPDGGPPSPESAAAALDTARQGSPGRLPFEEELSQELGADLSNLEVFFGPEAQAAFEAVQARAFCVQNVLAFSEDSPSREVVRHEVVHALQQGGDQAAMGATPGRLAATSEGDTEEQEARAGGEQLAFGKGDSTGEPALARLPAAPSGGVHKPGLSVVDPIIKEGYDGSGSVSVNDWDGWGMSSFRRRWSVYDANDKLVYEESYTWPHPTLTLSQDMIKKGEAGGKERPWSAWIEVTHTLVPFGGSNPKNFPYAYRTFEVHETWDGYMADPNAKLSDGQGPGEGDGDGDGDGSDGLNAPAVKGTSNVIDYGSVVAMQEAYLRTVYEQGAKGITETAKGLVKDGIVTQKQAAKWAVDARNGLKASVRSQGNPILKTVFEQRNLAKYADKLGPSYQQLYAKYARQGLSEAEINTKILEGAGKSNAAVNKWSGRLKWGGRVLLFVDICLAGARVYMAPEGQKLKTGLKEAFRIGGALAFGAAGAKGGAAAGAAIGALFGGAGAAPGAIIGGLIGAIGGALFGGWLGESAVEQLYKLLPPDGVVWEGESTTTIEQAK